MINRERQRFADEFVRHKILDAIGDMALAGAPLLARFEGRKSGHATNNALLRALFADPELRITRLIPSPAQTPGEFTKTGTFLKRRRHCI